jgi:addiction module RelB/DinJ family antitoxin
MSVLYWSSNTLQLAAVETVRYTPSMSRVIRSAMLQMRVAPEIKYASEHVLRRIGLNLTEATELFLRRMIIDQRLPFDVVAFDSATYTQLVLDWEDESRTISVKRDRRTSKSFRKSRPSKRE